LISQTRDLNWRGFLGLSEAEEKTAVRQVIKRNGALEKYNRWKIAAAISKAVVAVREKEDKRLVEELTDRVEARLIGFMENRHPNSAPAIEEIQDIVETILIESGEVSIAKAYIIYRARH